MFSHLCTREVRNSYRNFKFQMLLPKQSCKPFKIMCQAFRKALSIQVITNLFSFARALCLPWALHLGDCRLLWRHNELQAMRCGHLRSVKHLFLSDPQGKLCKRFAIFLNVFRRQRWMVERAAEGPLFREARSLDEI